MDSRWRHQIQEHKNLFILIAVGLFLLELEIFAMAALKSGPQTRLQILNQENQVIYSAKGNHLDNLAKKEFEQTFGPIADFNIQVVTVDRPFPFRAWFAGAVGLPVGAVLLFGFFVKAWEALFLRGAGGSQHPIENSAQHPRSRLENVIARISRFNIFILGAFVLLISVGLWAGPYLLTEFGRHAVAVIARYKWVVLCAVGIFLLLVVWIIYLRYRLAAKAIESRAEVEKYRLQLEILGEGRAPAQLADRNYLRLVAPKSTYETDDTKPDA